MDSWFEDFPFREHRAYVHSATLCNHLAQRFPTASRFELVLRRWMDSRVIFTPMQKADPAAAGIARIDLDGRTLILGLDDDKAHPVVARVPYDEDGLVQGAELTDEGLICEAGEGSFFDRMIAANKAVINRTLSPGVKLIATKIVTPGFPADDTVFRLKLDSHLGTRIFKSSLWFGDFRQGEVVYYGQ
jgi:hypothetical protein